MALLPVLYKIVERAMVNQLTENLERSLSISDDGWMRLCLLSHRQHGYHKYMSSFPNVLLFKTSHCISKIETKIFISILIFALLCISQAVMRNLCVHLNMIFGRIQELSLKLMISQKETNV